MSKTCRQKIGEGCIKLHKNESRMYDENCKHLAHPASDVRPAILCNFGDQFATNFYNTPLAKAPFSKFLLSREKCGIAPTRTERARVNYV